MRARRGRLALSGLVVAALASACAEAAEESSASTTTSAPGAGGGGGSATTGEGGSASTGSGGTGGAGGTPSTGDDESILVPAGTFNRQNDPALPATVSAFRLDRHEFTVARMRQYVASLSEPDKSELTTQLSTCAGGTWTDQPGGNESRPVNCVSKAIAEAACAWSGQRLPDELEWEYAAAGGDEQRFYPWSVPATSETIDASYAVYEAGDPSAILDVGSKPAGAGRWGHLDLGGNVWEIMRDTDNGDYVTVPTCTDCSFVDPTQTRYMRRGGGYESSADRLEIASRDSDPDDGIAEKGFRCADDP